MNWEELVAADFINLWLNESKEPDEDLGVEYV